MNDDGRMITHSCPFCERIGRRDYEGTMDGVVRFTPLRPVTPGHALFVPEEHIEHRGTVSAFDDQVGYAAMAVGRAMMIAAEHGYSRGEQFNLIVSNGEHATQTQLHVHVHYVPRTADDDLPLPWTFRNNHELLAYVSLHLGEHDPDAPEDTMAVSLDWYESQRLPIPRFAAAEALRALADAIERADPEHPLHTPPGD